MRSSQVHVTLRKQIRPLYYPAVPVNPPEPLDAGEGMQKRLTFMLY